MKGYMSYSITDNTNKKIACIQKFVEQLSELISIPQDKECVPFQLLEEIKQDDDLKALNIEEGFGLVEL